MKEDKNIQHLDKLLTKQFKELPKEKPSKGFTNLVMQAIQQEKSIAYTPLISKKIWFAIAAAVTALLVFPFKAKEGSLLEEFTNLSIDWSFLDNFSSINLIPTFTISDTTFYATLLFSVLFLVQVFYLKGYFSRRLES